VPGRPIALRPSPNSNRGLLSVSTPTGGLFLEVSAADGEGLVQSAESDVREGSILPAADAQTLARTVGIDARGRSWLTQWGRQGGGAGPTGGGAAAAGRDRRGCARCAGGGGGGGPERPPRRPVRRHRHDLHEAVEPVYRPRDVRGGHHGGVRAARRAYR